jgi:hypothetical protein
MLQDATGNWIQRGIQAVSPRKIANFFWPIATILQNDITGYGFLGLGCGSRVILKGDAGAEWNAR